jgi:hypothetical protein
MEAAVSPHPIKPTLFSVPRRLLLAGTIACLTVAGPSVVAPVASAAAVAPATCPSTTLSQPFLPWSDSNYYSLVSGGDFESASTGWTLSGGATRVAGSETYAVSGKLGAYSLALPAGASAQSPLTCVGVADRTFRFFAKGESSSATLVAQVVFQTLIGPIALPVGVLAPSGVWAPTQAFHTGAAIIGSISPTGTADVAIRITALGGTSRIDDVYLDPRLHR